MNSTNFALMLGGCLVLTMGVVFAITMAFSGGYAYMNRYGEGWFEAAGFTIAGLYILYVLFSRP